MAILASVSSTIWDVIHMDFSLLEKNPDFHFEEYFPAIIEEAKLLGREITITKKDKKNFSKVESVFLKDNTDIYNLSLQTEKIWR